jgi:hypothetical protein
MQRALTGFAMAFAILTIGALTSAADDTYKLKLYQPKTGDKTQQEKSDSGKTTIAVDFGGKKKDQEQITGGKEAFTEEILEMKVGARRPTKLIRTYTVAEKTANGITTRASYTGKSVLIEKKGDMFQFSVDGVELKQKDAPDLFTKFNKKDDDPQNQDLLPKDPVKVGQSWVVPADASELLFKSLNDDKMKLDTKKSTAGGKLVKVYKKNGAQFGVMDLQITIVVTEFNLGQFVKTKADSKIALKLVVDTCIDGTVPGEESTMSTTIDISAELANKATIAIKGTSKGTEKITPVK